MKDTTALAEVPSATPNRFDGVLLVGGRFTLGDSTGQDLASLLDAGVKLRNASIKGETLSSMLERLPYLLEQQPNKIILEVGLEDELAKTRLPALKRDLRRLERLLDGISWVMLCTAREPDYQQALRAFAEEAKVPYWAVKPEKGGVAALHDVLQPVFE
jgi:hypothetical protein